MAESPLMTVTEVAAYLRIHSSTVYRLLKKQQITAFKIGSDWRFNREHIDQWRLTQGTANDQRIARKAKKGDE